jgi:hypothetical protein
VTERRTPKAQPVAECVSISSGIRIGPRITRMNADGSELQSPNAELRFNHETHQRHESVGSILTTDYSDGHGLIECHSNPIHFTEGNEGNEEGFGTLGRSGMREHFVRHSDFPANGANERGWDQPEHRSPSRELRFRPLSTLNLQLSTHLTCLTPWPPCQRSVTSVILIDLRSPNQALGFARESRE